MGFFEHLEATARRNNSLVCVGLDPQMDKLPARYLGRPDPLYAFGRDIVDATRDLVCAYKPNFAFYEAHGLEGLAALQRTMDYIGPGTPVILDGKRGDIGSTAAAYARAAFDVWGAGALTVNPYLGGDSIEPYLAHTERGIFVLCHTSNPGAGDLQKLECAGEPLYLHVARLAREWGAQGHNVGLVVGATFPEPLRAVRAALPAAWILMPGVGAQGGDLQAALDAGLRPDGLGVIINSSRGIIFAPDPREAALKLRDEINAARKALPAEGVALGLFDAGCVRFGSFTLKSGLTSPVYIDLRLLASHPRLMKQVAGEYGRLLAGLNYDRLAAIPYAALPIGAAVSLYTEKPLIYPRKETKAHGTAQSVEGAFAGGERAVVLDDLITTGSSKIEAIAPLVEAGLIVEDIVVLIDRQSGGREDLADRGLRLHVVLTLTAMLDILVKHGRISAGQREEVLRWLQDTTRPR